MRAGDPQVPLGDPQFFAGDPDRVLADLRRSCPVSWQEGERFWALTRHADVLSVSRDPGTFRAGSGVLIADRAREVSPTDSILYLDPPVHGRYRNLVNGAFSPRRVASLEPYIRRVTRELLDEIDPGEPCNIVEALTAPLPLLVIAELLGVPADDRALFRVWSDAIMDAATNLTDENATMALELLMYFDRELDRRLSDDGRDDLLHALLVAEIDGERLPREHQLGFCMTLMVAGNETTRSLLSHGIVALAEHPEQRARLAADPSLLPLAVEEMLRWSTPIMALARTATCPAHVADVPVEQDEYLVMVYGAANRDEETFGPDASRFDVTRSPNPHVAFGFGEHFCVGAGLARLEARVVFSELLARWPNWDVVGEVRRPPSTLLRQIERLEVRFSG